MESFLLRDADGRTIEITTIEQGRDQMRIFNAEMRSIQLQLGDRNRIRPDGSRFCGHEYFQWRTRASQALAIKTEQYIQLKEWVTRNHQEDRIVTADDYHLLGEAYGLIKKNLIKLLPMTSEDQLVVQRLIEVMDARVAKADAEKETGPA